MGQPWLLWGPSLLWPACPKATDVLARELPNATTGCVKTSPGTHLSLTGVPRFALLMMNVYLPFRPNSPASALVTSEPFTASVGVDVFQPL